MAVLWQSTTDRQIEWKAEDFPKILRKNDIKMDELDAKLLRNFIKPNLKINDDATAKKIEENIRSLQDKEVKIYKGDITEDT